MLIKNLESRRFEFRRLTIGDSQALFRTFGDPEVMKYWIGGPDRNIAETEKRIVTINDHWEKHSFGDWGIVRKEDSELIGFGGLHFIDEMLEVNIGYALEKLHWRKGYGAEACQAVLEYGFKSLGLDNIVAVIWPQNKASIGIAEKCGLQYWKNIIWKGSERVVFKAERSTHRFRALS